jgi:hypothetical protein
MTIVVTFGNTQVVAVQASSSNTITINKTELVLTAIHEPNSIVVTAPISSIVNVVTAGPQGARVNLIAPVPTYNASGKITEINFNNGYRKVYTYDASGYLSTMTFYQPNLPTVRTTLTWVNGQWRGTSAPVEI